MKTRGSRDTEKAFTERAIEATEKFCEQNMLVSPLVYVPRKLRGHNHRLTIDDLKITTTPETLGENHVRIAKADPLGFLIAAMNGQPLPEFRVQQDGTIKVCYTTLSYVERLDIARFLSHKVTFRIPRDITARGSPIRAGQVEYDNIIDRAAAQEEANAVQETGEAD